MLRKITIGCAVVVAMLAVPTTLPAQAWAACTAWAADRGAFTRSVIARTSHDTTSLALLTFIAFITSGTTSYTFMTSGTGTCSPQLSASAVAGGGCQRDSAGTGCGSAIEQ